jgi:3-oxoacyl-[acyl-carrier protein] reductase
MSFAGRTVVVTGASRGIGRGIAEHFHDLGASVVLASRTPGALDDVMATLDAERALAVTGDVGREEDVEALMASAVDRFGGVDVLCHNAGIYPVARIEDITVDGWNEVLRVNLTSTFLTVQAAAPRMRARGGGRIVLTSSITGSRTGYPGLSHYSATKAGMSGFMRTATIELAPHGITMNAIEPGSIRTDGLAGLGADAIKVMEGNIPVGFLGEPRDIAATAAFLASDGARFITGQTIVVDGGQTLPEIPLASFA